MAAKYWCSGGTGNWSSLTNWSTTATSPRLPNTTAAGSSDTVIFDSISGAGTATVDSSVTIQTLTMTGFTGTLAFGTNTISCVNSGVFFTGDTTYSVTGTPLIISTYSGSVSRTITPSTPTEANSISFNISAGTGSIAITTGQSVRSLIFSGTYTGNLTSVTRTFYGNLTFKTGMTVSASSSTSTFAATSGTQTITSAALNLDFPITFAGTATYQLQDALSVGTNTARTITLTSGTLDLAGFTLTHFGNFSSSNSNTRTIAFGAGNYTNTNTNTGTVWGMTTATNFTYTGTPTVNITGNAALGITRTITFGNTAGQTETNSITVNVSAGSDTVSLQGGFLNVNLTSFTGTLANNTRSIYGNLTLPSGITLTAGTFTTTFASTNATVRTITTNGNNLDFPITFNGVGGSWQLQDNLACGTSTSRAMTLTAGTLDLNTFDVTLFGGFVGTGSTTRTIAFGTGKFFLTGTSGNLWSVTGTNLTITGTNPTITANANTSSGERTFSHVPTTVAENLAINMNITAGSADLGFGGGLQLVKSVNFTGFTGRVGNAGVTSAPQFNIYNNMTFNTGMTLVAGNVAFSFRGSSGTQVLTSNGVTINSPINFGTGTNTTTTYQLADALTVASDKAINLVSGIFDSTANSITCGTFGYSNTNTKTLTITNSSITITGGTSTSGFAGSSSGTTFNISGSSVTFTSVSSGQTALCNPAFTLPTVTMSLPSGTLIIGNIATAITTSITTLTNTVAPCTFSLNTAMTGLNVANFNVNGTAGNLVVLNAVTAGTAKTITKTGGGTTNVDYLNIKDSTATGGTWNAYSSTDSGNNTGWNFLTLSNGNFFLMFG